MWDEKKKVLLFGTFDVLHPGHMALFRQARRFGDEIVVILARDSTVKAVKKHAPLHKERARERMLKQSGWVDKVILGSVRNKYKLIKKIKPNIICLGYDQKYFVGELTKKIKLFKLKTRIVRLKPFKPHIYKSTFITRYVRHKIYQGTRGGN